MSQLDVSGLPPGVPDGDPVALEWEADILRQTVETVEGLTADFVQQARTVTGRSEWAGRASDLYQRRSEWLIGELRRVAPVLRTIASALDEYAARLRWAQSDARLAVSAWHAALHLPPGTQAPALDDARQGAAVARARAEEASIVAGAAISEARAGLPRFRWDAGDEAGWLGLADAIHKDADRGLAVGKNFYRNFMREVSGYTTKNGTVVQRYMRWRLGTAGVMNKLISARDLRYLKYADRADWPMAFIAGGIAGYDKLQADQRSGHHFTQSQEAARVVLASGLVLTETAIAGATGVAVGAWVGTLIDPGPGTVVGASAGWVAGSGLAIGAAVAIDALHLNDRIEQGLNSLAPGVLGP
jgi:uncharacterized protein YukE